VSRERDALAAENERLHQEIERLADLAAEHLNCSGCPAPWWLNNWLLTVASDDPGTSASGVDRG